MTRPFAVAVAALAAIVAPGSASGAEKDPQEREPPRCLSDTREASFSASTRSAKLRQPILFSWEVTLPPACGEKSLDLYIVYHCGTPIRLPGLKGSVTLPASARRATR